MPQLWGRYRRTLQCGRERQCRGMTSDHRRTTTSSFLSTDPGTPRIHQNTHKTKLRSFLYSSPSFSPLLCSLSKKCLLFLMHVKFRIMSFFLSTLSCCRYKAWDTHNRRNSSRRSWQNTVLCVHKRQRLVVPRWLHITPPIICAIYESHWETEAIE